MNRKLLVLLGIALLLLLAMNTSGGKIVSAVRSLVGYAADGIMPGPGLQAEQALVLDASTGRVLFAKNERLRAYPASTTKILTALIALEKGKPDDIVTIGSEANPEDPEESRAGIRPGQQIKLYDLIEAALLPSGNDAARSLAVHIGRKAAGTPGLDAAEAQKQFAKLMNERAKKAGATDSHFVNASGLHDPKHYTTAKDMALIAKAAMANPAFREAVRATDYVVAATGARGGGGAGAKLALTNTNQLLQPGSPYYFEGATGIKTGFTDQAGYCLVSSVSAEGKQIIAVVLRSTGKDVYPDARKLLEYGLSQAAGAAKPR
ncbi:D-alanyl-D-alanine carboxypeptidase family protein [Paenibacillus ginsengarvi]|nr:D-alanyl-D-alanine carboxypeptidase family protein [Paenibacillus ginsengarvi]